MNDDLVAEIDRRPGPRRRSAFIAADFPMTEIHVQHWPVGRR